MAADQLHTLSISEATSRMAAGGLTSADLVSALVDRIGRTEPRVRAWTTLEATGALETARARDRERASGNVRGPLHGIPMGIKDVFDTRGMPTTCGWFPPTGWAPDIPNASAEAVRRLEHAGAVILGKLATSPFAALDPAETRNPRNTGHTPGGSSSGSAAAVASGMCPAAIGTQTAGSIGRPAAFCGIVGCMPTQARISRAGLFPAAPSLDHVGAFARSVDDARTVVGVLSGESLADPDGDGRQLRIGVPAGYFERHAEPEAWRIHAAFIERLASNPGFSVGEIRLPGTFEESVAALWTIMKSEIAAVHRERYREHASRMPPRLGALVGEGLGVRAADYLDALDVRRRFRETMAGLFTGADVLVSPGAPGPAPEGLESTGNPAMNAPWTLADLPTVSLPLGDWGVAEAATGGRLPLGIQVSAAPLEESLLFAAARRIERVARA